MSREGEWAATDCAHPDCDGWRMSSAHTVRDDFGTFVAVCDCGWRYPEIGSTSRDTAERYGRKHGHSERCDGRCARWDDES